MGAVHCTSLVLQIPAPWSDVAETSLKGLNHHGNRGIPQPLRLLAAGTLADGVLHSQPLLACAAATEELVWELRERAGLLSKELRRNGWGTHGNKHLQMALAFT